LLKYTKKDGFLAIFGGFLKKKNLFYKKDLEKLAQY
jgi:hypothetical protein